MVKTLVSTLRRDSMCYSLNICVHPCLPPAPSLQIHIAAKILQGWPAWAESHVDITQTPSYNAALHAHGKFLSQGCAQCQSLCSQPQC